MPCQWSLRETQEGQQLGHLAAQTPSTPATRRGTLPHLSCWEEECPARAPAFPCSRARERLIFSTWPLFPAWRELKGQSRKESGPGGQKDYKQGFSGEKYYRSKREFFLHWIISNHGYNRKT